MLLEALAACAGVTLRSVATAMGLSLQDVRIRAEGSFDARGTLGLDRTVPVGVQDIVVTAAVEGDVDDVQLERLSRSTERYCVVSQTLREPSGPSYAGSATPATDGSGHARLQFRARTCRN